MNTFLRNATAPKEEEEDMDLRPCEHEKAVMRAYRSLRAPPHLNTQEACNETVRINVLLLVYVPDRYKIHEMCDKGVGEDQGLCP